MITIESPSMAINDSRAAVNYQMDQTITVQPITTMSQLVQSVVNQANSINSQIKNLILTAHGNPGFFQIGTGLNSNTMNPFRRLRGKVFKIWFRGCLIGRIIDSQTPGQGDGPALQQMGVTSGNGHAFLSAFARLTGCYVVAPTEIQCSRLTLYPNGVMDSYEGLVLSYDPQGKISWQNRYPSLYGHNPQAGTAMNPNTE
jgi:hypothetical protein